jgi:hypothetical protein
MAHDALGRDLCHVLVSLMRPVATTVSQSEGDGVGKVARVSEGQLFIGVGHAERIAEYENISRTHPLGPWAAALASLTSKGALGYRRARVFDTEYRSFGNHPPTRRWRRKGSQGGQEAQEGPA